MNELSTSATPARSSEHSAFAFGDASSRDAAAQRSDGPSPCLRSDSLASLGESTESESEPETKSKKLPYKADLYLDRYLNSFELKELVRVTSPPGAQRLKGPKDVVTVRPSDDPAAECRLRLGSFSSLKPSDDVVREKLGVDPADHLKIRHDENDASYDLAIEVARLVATVPLGARRVATGLSKQPLPPKVALVSRYPDGCKRVFLVPNELPERTHGAAATERSEIRARPVGDGAPSSPGTSDDASSRLAVAALGSPDPGRRLPVKRRLVF